jgi:hypothetical protein
VFKLLSEKWCATNAIEPFVNTPVSSLHFLFPVFDRRELKIWTKKCIWALAESKSENSAYIIHF